MQTGVADILGIIGEGDPFSAMTLVTEVERGLPLAALDRVLHEVAPHDNAFAYRIVPRATLARRRTAGPAQARLSPEEGGRLARLAAVWELAVDLWGGAEAARAFLFRTHPLLDGRRPVDVVLANEFGRPLVEDILGRLKYGTGV